MSIKFLNRIHSKENESLYSFLFRTARANYFNHITDAIPVPPTFYKLNCNELNTDSQWFKIAKEIMDNSNQDIGNFVCNQFDDLFFGDKEEDIIKHEIFYSYYLRNFTKYCPACLKEDYYHRIHWDIAFLTTCPSHNTQLVLNCPKCHGFISMHSLMSGTCKCGFNYLNVEADIIKSPAITKVQTNLQMTLLNPRSSIKRSDGSLLDGKVYLMLFSLFYQLLGSLQTEKLVSKKQSIKFEKFLTKHMDMKKHLIEYMNFLTPVIQELVIQPEKNILSLYETIDDLKTTKYGSALSSKKSPILKVIFASSEGKLYSDYYSKFHIEIKEIYHNKDKLIQSEPLERSYIGITDAEKHIGRSKTFIKTLCELNFLEHKYVEHKNRDILLIKTESVLKWAEHESEIMSTRDARKYLGITQKQYRNLIETDYLKVLHGPTIDGMTSYFVDRREVYDLEKSLLSKCQRIEQPNDNWYTLDSAKDKVGKEEVTFVELIKMVLDSKVQVAYVISEPIIEGLYFSKQDIQSLRLESFKQFVKEKGYSKMELMRIFKLRTRTVNKWFEDGILKIDYSVQRGTETLPYVNRDQALAVLKEVNGFSKNQALSYLDEWDNKFSSLL